MTVDLTPNRTPDGERCGSCRFAGTHIAAEHRRDQVVTRCQRFPPMRRGKTLEPAQLGNAFGDTLWPYTTWDEWCGEWQERDPEPDANPEPMGFRP